MHAIMIAVALAASGPIHTPETQLARLTSFVSRVNPEADDYAEHLAGAIIGAARRHHLDPNVLAAICWSESYYQTDVDGASGERGPWQLMRGMDIMAGAWNDVGAAMHGLPDYPDADWGDMPRDDQDRAMRDPVLSTYMAAVLVAWHRARCEYPTTATCYARYNSGGPRVRWGYVRALARRAYLVRRYVDADVM